MRLFDVNTFASAHIFLRLIGRIVEISIQVFVQQLQPQKFLGFVHCVQLLGMHPAETSIRLGESLAPQLLAIGTNEFESVLYDAPRLFERFPTVQDEGTEFEQQRALASRQVRCITGGLSDKIVNIIHARVEEQTLGRRRTVFVVGR